MEIDDILLKSREIYIGDGQEKPRLVVPIHPSLLRKDIKIDERLGYETLSRAIKPWRKDVNKYHKIIKDTTSKKSINIGGVESVHDDVWIIKPEDIYIDRFGFMDNGLVRTFQLGDENALYLDQNNTISIHQDEAVFKAEKLYEYSCKKDDDILGSGFATCYAYQVHNLGNYRAALFLKNWAVIYLNTALKQILK